MQDDRAGCIGFFFSLFGIGRRGGIQAQVTLPKVMVSNRFVTRAEADFFRVLTRVVGDRGHVLAQVSLKQLLFLPGSNQSNPGRSAWQNKINQRSIDFLVCDAATLTPLVAIELDEGTHTAPERQTRDEEVEVLLTRAGLQWIRVNTSRMYDTRELDASLSPFLPVRR